MPFNPTTGVFLRTSNTFSVPVTGTIIDPDDADELFDDYDLALTQSGAAVKQTITTATYVVLPADAIIYVNRAGTVTLTLPDAAAWLAAHPTGQLIIQDISGAASTNNITINRAGSDTINGLTSVTITSDYGGYKLRPAASGLWVVQ